MGAGTIGSFPDMLLADGYFSFITGFLNSGRGHGYGGDISVFVKYYIQGELS